MNLSRSATGLYGIEKQFQNKRHVKTFLSKTRRRQFCAQFHQKTPGIRFCFIRKTYTSTAHQDEHGKVRKSQLTPAISGTFQPISSIRAITQKPLPDMPFRTSCRQSRWRSSLIAGNESTRNKHELRRNGMVAGPQKARSRFSNQKF